MVPQPSTSRRFADPPPRQLKWYLFFRVLVITLFLGGAIAYHLRGLARQPQGVLTYLYLLVGASFLQTIVSALVLGKVRHLKRFIQGQVVWDLLFATALVYLSGGIDSLFSFFYLLIIISASFFFSRQEILFVASAAAILYGSLLDLQFYGYLPWFFGDKTAIVSAQGGSYFFAVFVNVSAFYLTALLGGALAERQRRSALALEKREIDYGELENLNRTILGNISSGLMMINDQGRIRSFNTAAEKITGYSLEEAYNHIADELLSGLTLLEKGRFVLVSRGEARVPSRFGGELILGYNTSLVRDARGNVIGMLVAFQDLSGLKQMEEQLQRADRLAAVGRLASGMAHEIRNPLASISGSVQLLMEGAHVTDEDRRLMRIVVKEAERLSGLLTDFLVYARPVPPRPTLFNMSALLDELSDMLQADARFSRVEIRREFAAGVLLNLDRQQFHQALWDLVINGAEAMGDAGGVLRLGIVTDALTIYVEDSGPGISAEVRTRIFEPFFTTKDWGTGLGLATVYAIVEAHGGQIEVDPGEVCGTRFTIHLPEEVKPALHETQLSPAPGPREATSTNG